MLRVHVWMCRELYSLMHLRQKGNVQIPPIPPDPHALQCSLTLIQQMGSITQQMDSMTQQRRSTTQQMGSMTQQTGSMMQQAPSLPLPWARTARAMYQAECSSAFCYSVSSGCTASPSCDHHLQHSPAPPCPLSSNRVDQESCCSSPVWKS